MVGVLGFEQWVLAAIGSSPPHPHPLVTMRDDAVLPPTLSSDRTTAVDAIEKLEETAKLFMILRDVGYRTLTEKHIQNTVG